MNRILIFLFCLTNFTLFAQPCDFSSSLKAINDLILNGSFDNALLNIEKLKSCDAKTDSVTVAIYTAEYKAFRNKYKYHDAERAILKAEKILKKNATVLPFEFRLLLAENYAHRSQIDLYKSIITPIEDSILSPLNKSEELLGRYYLASFRTSESDAGISKVINILLEASKHFEKLDNPPVFYYGNNMRSLGNMYRNAGDFDKSIFYYKKGQEFISKYYPQAHYEVAYYDYTIAAVYYEKMEYQIALDYFLNAHKVWKNILEPDDRYMRYLNEGIGDMYWELDDRKNALLFFNYSMIDEEQISNDMSESSIKKGDSLIETGNYADALEHYKEAYKWREDEFGKSSIQTGACKNFVARAIHHSGDTEGALTAYQEAINILVPDFQQTSWSMNPSLEMNIQSHQYLQESMIAKGELLKELYYKTNDLTQLKSALRTQEFAIILLEDLRNIRLSEASREFWTQRTLTLIESSINTAITLYETTTEVSFLHKAFNFSERSKALLLLASLYDHEINSFANVSEAIISEEIELKMNINNYAGKIETEEKRCADVRTKILTLWRTELNSLQSEYDLLVQRIETEYPEYYQLKYQLEIPEVSEFQNSLVTNRSCLISYFVGVNSIYIFQITKGEISVRTIENSIKLSSQISSFFENSSSMERLQNSPQEVYEVYVKEGFSLYEQLLQPELENKNFDELLIIPDGKLCYLPFESLLISAVPTKPRNYAALPYLLNEYSTSYSPSAAIQLLAKNNDKTYNTYLGFAPDYEGQEYEESSRGNLKLTKLKYNTQEVDVASKLFNGLKWTGNAVTEDLLKNESTKAGIIHLAMHGAIEDEHPLLSKLYFNSSESEDGMLHIYEIYNMDLSAQLVILSACNTASGKLVRGEGIVSLERAFQYAGSKALMSTLWKVDDAASSQITESFLKNLKAGKPKNIALQEAKIEFLASAPPEKLSPFYWSSFKLTGNTQPLIIKSENKLLYITLGGLSILVAIILFRQRIARSFGRDTNKKSTSAA